MPTQLVVDTQLATIVPNSTYTIFKNNSWQVLVNPALDANQFRGNIMYGYDQNDTVLFPVRGTATEEIDLD